MCLGRGWRHQGPLDSCPAGLGGEGGVQQAASSSVETEKVKGSGFVPSRGRP